jgi:hypothetical protein
MNNNIVKLLPFFLILLVFAGCRSNEHEIDLFIEKVMTAPDSFDSILAHNEISKIYHDSVFVHYVLDQQIGFVKEIGDGYSTRKILVVNDDNPKHDDVEVSVMSKDKTKWLEFRFSWIRNHYCLVEFTSHLAH